MSQAAPVTNVFDGAKAIVEILKDLDKPAQVQAIRFASESLGLQLSGSAPQIGQASVPATPATPNSGTTLPPTDIKAFTQKKSPKSDQQFAAVVAYFYQFVAPMNQRKDTIDADTMKEAARLAGRRQPAKWRFALKNAKSAGYLDSAGDGRYKLSPVGENLVAITLPGNSAPGKTSGGGRKSAKTTTQKKRAKKSR